MLQSFKFILFKLKLFHPTEKTIRYWKNSNDLKKLHYTLQYGNYKTRALAANALSVVKHNSSIPLLLNTINDNIQNVSIASLNTLEKLDTDKKYIKLINSKRFNWVKLYQIKIKQQENKKDKKYNIYRWERSSKKSFEMVKERLKRPIR